VAMGSPVQEEWLKKHAPQLQCNTALAVGGLFDFYSGNIPRAPLWMRELGMEWVWRLLQEPKTKFKRYIIGNPRFLIQTFILNHTKRGF
jgi:exopolysaccharide biosynthesis WecB/TagA/CpsF family protein